MRKAIVALVMVCCGICLPHCVACADVAYGNFYGDVLRLRQDTYFNPGAVIDVDKVCIDDSLSLENHATVLGDIYVCDECNFSVRNSGVISGRINIGNAATVTQVIQNTADMSRLNIDGDYVVLAYQMHDVGWDELKAFGREAGTLIVRDSSIILSLSGQVATYGVRRDLRTILEGEITVRLPDEFAILPDAPIIRDVEGNARITFEGVTPGELYVYVSDVRNNDLYVTLARETDYVKILGDGRGSFLNMLRSSMPDDALLRRLDAAQSIQELQYIMSNSVAFNPWLLGRPIRVLNKFMMDSVGVNSANMMFARPFYVRADDFNIYGAMTDFVFQLNDNMSGGISLYGAVAESDDEINLFTSDILGGKMFMVYRKDIWLLRGLLGGTYSDFDVPYVFYNNRVRDNLRGVYAYGVGDVGVRLGKVTSYVGAEYNSEYMLHEKKRDVAARAGIEALFGSSSEIGRYSYKIKLGINSAEVANAGMGFGFFSPDDMIGAEVSIDFLHDECGSAAMLSMSAKVLF